MLGSDHGNTLKKQSDFTNIGIIQLYRSTFFFFFCYHQDQTMYTMLPSRALYVLSELGEIRQHIYNLTEGFIRRQL